MMKHEFTRRSALKLGLTAGATIAAGTLLAGCSDPSEGVAAADADLTAWQKSNIEWQRYAGTTIVFGASTHQWITALQPHIPIFEKLTGMRVRLDVAGEEQFNTKLPVDLDSRSATPDVFMVPSYGQAVEAKWLQPLDAFFDDSKLTDETWYAADDVFRSAWDFVTWKDGSRYGIPITAEIQTTIFRSDLVDEAPATFDDLESVVRNLVKSGEIEAGIALRGKPTAGSIAWPAAGYVFSYGGFIIDPSGSAALTSPETVAAVQRYADILKAGGPKGISSWDWLEVNTAMQQGRAAIMQDSSNAIPDLRDPEKSKFSTSIAAGAFPSQNGVSNPNIWHWVTGVNANSKNKEAAWLFLLWASSAPTGLLLSSAGATPPRTSSWTNPEFMKGFGETEATAVVRQLETVDSKPMVASWMHPKWAEVGDAFARAVNTAVTSETTAKDALQLAQDAAQKALA